MKKNFFLPRKNHLAPLALFFFLFFGWGALHATEIPDTAAASAPAKLQEAQLKSTSVEAEQKKQCAVTLVRFDADNKTHLDFIAHAINEGKGTDAEFDQETLDLYMAGFGKGTDSGLFVITTGKECVGWAQILPPLSLIEADMKSWPEKMRSYYESATIGLNVDLFKCFGNSFEEGGIYIAQKFRKQGFAVQAFMQFQQKLGDLLIKKAINVPSYDSTQKRFIPKTFNSSPDAIWIHIKLDNTASLGALAAYYAKSKIPLKYGRASFVPISPDGTVNKTTPPTDFLYFAHFNPKMSQDTAFQEKFKDLLLLDLDPQTFAKIFEESKALNNPLVALASTPSSNTAAAPNTEKENAKAPPPTTGN